MDKQTNFESEESRKWNEQFFKRIEEILYPTLPYRSKEKDYDIGKNVNSLMCIECGGACCKMCGCHFSPDDFEEISFESLKIEIDKGYISIDYVDGEIIYQDFGVYILRIRNQDAPVVDIGLRKRTQCILLTEKGCKLDYEHRPTGGKLLVPNSASSFSHQMNCKSNYNISDCCYEWAPHKKLLYQLSKYYKEKEIPCSL